MGDDAIELQIKLDWANRNLEERDALVASLRSNVESVLQENDALHRQVEKLKAAQESLIQKAAQAALARDDALKEKADLASENARLHVFARECLSKAENALRISNELKTAADARAAAEAAVLHLQPAAPAAGDSGAAAAAPASLEAARIIIARLVAALHKAVTAAGGAAGGVDVGRLTEPPSVEVMAAIRGRRGGARAAATGGAVAAAGAPSSTDDVKPEDVAAADALRRELAAALSHVAGSTVALGAASGSAAASSSSRTTGSDAADATHGAAGGAPVAAAAATAAATSVSAGETSTPPPSVTGASSSSVGQPPSQGIVAVEATLPHHAADSGSIAPLAEAAGASAVVVPSHAPAAAAPAAANAADGGAADAGSAGGGSGRSGVLAPIASLSSGLWNILVGFSGEQEDGFRPDAAAGGGAARAAAAAAAASPSVDEDGAAVVDGDTRDDAPVPLDIDAGAAAFVPSATAAAGGVTHVSQVARM